MDNCLKMYLVSPFDINHFGRNYFLFIFLFLFLACSADEKEILIIGNIQKQEFFDLSESEIQLVPLTPGNVEQVDPVIAKFNNDGTFASLNYPSDYHSEGLLGKTKFTYRVSKLVPGKYILAVHKLKPTFVKVFNPSDAKYFTRALKTNTDQYIIIDVSKEILPPLKINLNDVLIPLEDEKMLIRRNFPNPTILKY